VALKDRLHAVGDDGQGGHNLDVYRRLLREAVDITELAKLNATQKRARLERVMANVLSREGPLLTPKERSAVIRRVVDEALGLGVLEPLLADPSITEVMVNAYDDIYVERYGRLERMNAAFADEEQLYQTIDRIVSGVNRRIDESSPMVDARLPTGERVNVVIPPLALDGPVLTIRRFPRPYPLSELVQLGTLDEVTAALLGAAVRARLNMIVSGGTGAGKTTILNALSGLIQDAQRVITVEDAAELQLQQSHVIRLESRPGNVEGAGEVRIRDLVRNALRMRPDRIIVGEVRGGETLDMLQAMNTGHDGSLCTVHANSPLDSLSRLETLASMSEVKIPFDALRIQVNNAVDIVVHVERAVDGVRRITSVSNLVSRQSREQFELLPLVEFVQDPVVRGQPTSGAFVHYPLPKGLADRLYLAGEEVPEFWSNHGQGVGQPVGADAATRGAL
jgi:pilus assembly protein CpaF